MNQLNALCRLVMAEKEARHLHEIIRLTRENVAASIHLEGAHMAHYQSFTNKELRVSAGKVLEHIDKAAQEMADYLAESRGCK